MTFSTTAALILDRAKVLNLPSTYILGNYSKRVTFQSQQHRALNLVWALSETNIIRIGSKVAIIGAGLAGLTTALAMKKKGCHVEIYEAGDQIMNLQRGNFTRYIHPNIYDWPRAGSSERSTNLPFLNWEADTTDNVIRQIEQEWHNERDDIVLNLNHRVTTISADQSMPRVSVMDPYIDEVYDCVVVATGFGLEMTMDNGPRRFYWSSDDLHQPIKSSKKIVECLVSGCGDGGLIDVLRLAIKDFRHETFTEDFLNAPAYENLKSRLIEIDQHLPRLGTDDSRYLLDEYKKIDVPDELLQKFKRRLRSDTKITIVSSTLTPISFKASILNRFAIFLLIKLGKLSYRQARVERIELISQSYAVTLNASASSIVTLPFDEVVIRHGPKPVISDLISGSVATLVEYDHETAQQLWPADFYPERRTIPLSKFELASQYKEELAELVRKAKNVRDVGVAIAGIKDYPYFLVTYSGKLTSKLNSLNKFHDFPIKFYENPNFTLNMSHSADIQIVEKESMLAKKLKSAEKSLGMKRFEKEHLVMDSIYKPLTIGSQIWNKETNSGAGTLGCFVILPNGQLGILSTNHVLNSNIPGTKTIFAKPTKESDEVPIGFFYKSISPRRSSRGHKHRYAGDAAIGILNLGVEFSTLINFGSRSYQIKDVKDPNPGQSVLKVGAGSGFTKGKVIAVGGKIFVNVDMEKHVFDDAILVISESATPFSKPGDSGALVFDDSGIAYGLVIGTDGNMTLVYPLKPILDQLECRLYVSSF